MGNSNSNVESSESYDSSYKRIIKHYNFPNLILKNDLTTILQNYDNSFVTTLCNYYPDNEEISENDFDELLDNFNFKSSEKFMKFLIRICHIDKVIVTEQMKLLFKWISFSSSDDFCDIMFNSYAKYLDQSNEFDVNNFLSWIDRNFSDLGLDFARSVYRVLNCDCSSQIIQPTYFDVVTQLKSSILDVSEIVILFSCLPMIYKSSGNIEELSFHHCKHWFMLYHSGSQGLSSSKFKETCFDYNGPLLVLFKSSSGVFCLATDVGLKEDWNSYGGTDARVLQLRPFYQKYLSGSRSQNNNSGIIYSHFSAKSGRRGLFVGHNPLQRPALEMNEDCNIISVMGKSEPLLEIECWAVGFDVNEKTAKLKDIRNWERKEVNKHQNRKLNPEKWENNPDRDILDWGGVKVRHTDFIGGPDHEEQQ